MEKFNCPYATAETVTLNNCEPALTSLAASFSSPQPLAERSCKEIARLDAMRRVVRARVNTTGFRMFGAKIAGRGFFLHDSLFLPGMLVVLSLRRERMHIDVPVRAIFRAEAAADAPILDDHLK